VTRWKATGYVDRVGWLGSLGHQPDRCHGSIAGAGSPVPSGARAEVNSMLTTHLPAEFPYNRREPQAFGYVKHGDVRREGRGTCQR